MRNDAQADEWKVAPLVPNLTEVLAATSASKIHLGSPSIAVMPGGRVVVSCDQYGPGVRALSGKKGKLRLSGHWVQGQILVSRDKGETWTARERFPFRQATLFRDRELLYLLGNKGNVEVAKSPDGGETWSQPGAVTPDSDEAGIYVNPPANVVLHDHHFYSVMMRLSDPSVKGEPSSVLAPVVMRARRGTNLLTKKSWTLSTPVRPFRDWISREALGSIGVPFFDVPREDRGTDLGKGRWANREGWRAAHILRIRDANHQFFDPEERTFHVLARTDTHRSNLAAFAKVTVDGSGDLTFGLETTPASGQLAVSPLPGGNLGFHIVYDEETRLFWLLGNQVRDSMVHPLRLPHTRPGLPCEERARLQLSFSRNLIDWSFAGFVCEAPEGEVVQDPRMDIHGNAIYFVCAAGEPHRRSTHGTTAVKFGMIRDFRELVY